MRLPPAVLSTPLLLLCACQPGGGAVDEQASWEPRGQLLPVGDVAPAPLAMVLTVGDAIGGSPLTLSVTGAQPGATVMFGASTVGAAGGPCPPILGGTCLDLQAPVRLVGADVADAGGSAAVTVTVPISLVGRILWFQAVIPGMASGTEAVLVRDPPSGSGWLMGYHVGYESHLLPSSAVDFAHLTHVVVGRVWPETDGSVTTTFDIDPVTGPAWAADLAARTRAAGRVPLLMVGGAGEYQGFVGAASPAHRAAFVTNLLDVMDTLGFDGLDIDWEPILPADRGPLGELVHALRVARPDIVLTMPVGWTGINDPDLPAFWGALSLDLDRLSVMSYGMADAWPGWRSWHSSALHGATSTMPSAVDVGVQAYLDAGVPAHKLGVGAGFYGSCWTGVTGPDQDPGGGGVIASDGTMSYANILASYQVGGTARYDVAAEAPYLMAPGGIGPLGCTFISYEDEASLTAKAAWVRQQGLGAVIVWTIAQGHLAGAAPGQRDPLLRALFDGLVP